MNRIRLLPENVANQIAAGEVVERPASVVKELVENALDAKSTRISVEIQAGGRSLIRVTDDGIGMSRDDALLCLERHATSKIKLAEDLYAIATMGFRGEALPSLASVSRLALTTREQGPETQVATQVIVHGGRIMEVKEAGAPPGTCVEARQLFYNLPARRKFLRSEDTERAHIQHYLTLAALANPEVAFSFTVDQRLIWQLPAHKTNSTTDKPLAPLHDRLRTLHSPDIQWLPVHYMTTLALPMATDPEATEPPTSLYLWGFVGAPGLSRATRENQYLFVNRRPVENRGLNFALVEGYHTALMKGRYPVCCLLLEVSPAEVDVNIHPAKREVRFRHENAVRQRVTEAVRKALLDYHSPGSGPLSAISGPNIGSQAPVSASRQQESLEPSVPSAHPSLQSDASLNQAVAIPAPYQQMDMETVQAKPGIAPSAPGQDRQMVVLGPPTPDSGYLGKTSAVTSPVVPVPSEAVPLLAVPLRLVGVIGHLYVVLESDRGLVLMDQHAAHERILFEQMLQRLEQGQAPSQRLLLAETIELPPRDALFLREQLAILTRLGIGLSEFGERTFLLDALPPFVKMSDGRRFLFEVIDELKASGQAVNSWRLGEHTVAKTVCRHAVKAHDPLSMTEIEKLVEDLRRCAMPYTCPHGRPTLIEMNFRELEKRFGRIQ